MCKFIILILIVLQFTSSCGFINVFIHNTRFQNLCMSSNCNERALYLNYLIGLRKTRNYIKQGTKNIDSLKYILNTTNRIVNKTYENSTITSNSLIKNIGIDNTEIGIKNIMFGKNIVLDVSNVKYIHISTDNDSISIEIDKKKDNIDTTTLFDKINNVEILLNTLSLLNQFLNSNN